MTEFPIDFFRDEVRCGFYIPTAVKQAWAAELEALAHEMNIDPDGDMREALFFSQESDYWKGRVLDAKSFRRNFRQILSDMRRRDGA